MKTFVLTAFVLSLVSAPLFAAEKSAGVKTMTGPLDLKMTGIDGKEIDLSKYHGKVVLLVNVASECGYTPQYKGLQALYEKFSDKGLVVLGVPSNEFGSQEPGSNDEILKFCKSNYMVTFPMLAKVVVKGDGQVPLYQYLTSKKTNPKFAGEIGWNFEKFLIGKDGQVIGRYKSSVEPLSEQLTTAIKTALEAK